MIAISEAALTSLIHCWRFLKMSYLDTIVEEGNEFITSTQTASYNSNVSPLPVLMCLNRCVSNQISKLNYARAFLRQPFCKYLYTHSTVYSDLLRDLRLTE